MKKISALEKLRTEMKGDRGLPMFNGANLVFGEGDPNAEVMFIGEAPGFHENKHMRPFVGRAGQLLNKLLAEIGWARDEFYPHTKKVGVGVYITNIVKRRPPKNRDPLPKEIKSYEPYLNKQIQIINPKIIVTLGRFAMNYFLPAAKISEAHGKGCVLNGVIIYPLYHPAAALRSTKVLKALEHDFKKIPKLLKMEINAKIEAR